MYLGRKYLETSRVETSCKLSLLVSFVNDNLETILEHTARLFDGEVGIKVGDEIRKSHHLIGEDVRPDVDAGNDLLLNQGLL
jgi:hypothetical protein